MFFTVLLGVIRLNAEWVSRRHYRAQWHAGQLLLLTKILLSDAVLNVIVLSAILLLIVLMPRSVLLSVILLNGVASTSLPCFKKGWKVKKNALAYLSKVKKFWKTMSQVLCFFCHIGDHISIESSNVNININNVCNLINHIKGAI